jgi:hypothetical protein
MAANSLGFLDLKLSRACGSDGEEQLWVFVTAGGFVAPVHAYSFVDVTSGAEDDY